MGKAVHPRHGSMQFWPHRRAKKVVPVVKAYPQSKDAVAMGFAGYKVGMTHVQYVETSKNSPKKGETVTIPVTILECPPLTVVGVKAYTKKGTAKQTAFQVLASSLPKKLQEKIPFNCKKTEKELESVDDTITEIALLMATQPQQTTVGSKQPQFFELAIGGSVQDQLAYAKENIGKDIAAADVLKEGSFVDIHSVTKGKGFSGAVARFGIRTRSHKSEKGIRTAGSLGGWRGSGHIMHRVPAPGKHGFYTRTTHNQQIIAIGDDPAKINADGGFVRYGNVKNTYVLIKGSVHGSKKRLVRLSSPIRPPHKPKVIKGITHVHTGSQQG